ncbi:ABC transporter substrate-binding protein [Kitasatospora sp. NBC_01266]|uniref:ABC transporter substrate-binding protein n=1 Tax=Kitasatospora sp. NBC_01266 TaxID=2903572 RepID=UPI002E30EAF0|nr:ABC transporter substrate-binding protein [Kitasatospora sp. NBC_01266]
MRTRTRRCAIATLGPLLVAGTLVVAGCGSSTTGGAPSTGPPIATPSAVPSLAAQVPADIRSSGQLVVATDASYAPNEFKDPKGDIVGMDVDLARAIAQTLGLTADVQNADFTSIIPGITANKYQLGMSSFTDTKEREATVDMVTYFSAGTSTAVKAGNPDKIDPNDLCGKKIAVQTGTTQVDEITDVIDPACKQAGKPGIPNGGDLFDLQTDVTLALIAGRDQVMLADSPVVDYAVQQTGGQVEKIGATADTAPYGIVVAKNSPLTKAVQGAVESLIANGVYQQILTKWGVQSGAVNQSVINGASS